MPEPDATDAHEDAPDPASEPSAGAPKKRETPWSVFIVAGIFFAIGLWLYLDVRREVKEAEAAKARAPQIASGKPKILGLDVIPQLAESNEAKVRPSPSAATAPAAGAAPPAASASAAAPSAGPAPPAASASAAAPTPSASR